MKRLNITYSIVLPNLSLRIADEESVDFLCETVGTSFEQYTRNSGDSRTPSESEEKEEYHFAKGDLRNFDAGEAVICWQGIDWVHGRIKLLNESDDGDTTDREQEQAGDDGGAFADLL